MLGSLGSFWEGSMQAGVPLHGEGHRDRPSRPETTKRVWIIASTQHLLLIHRSTPTSLWLLALGLGEGNLILLDPPPPPPPPSPSCSLSYLNFPLPPACPPSLVRVAFSFDDKAELVVVCDRALFYLYLHFPSPGRHWESTPLPHPHCESILIEQRRRLNCLRLACTTPIPHVLSKIILIRKLPKSLVLASVSYSAVLVL